MARVDVKLADAIEAVATYLRTALSLNERTCFWSLTNEIPHTPPSGWWLCLTPDGGDFDAGMFDGGGRDQLTTDTGVVVNINSTVKLDSHGHDKMALTESTRGLLSILHSVLNALAGQDLTVSTNTFQRELLQPQGFSRPERSRENPNVCTMSVIFKLSFDWDLT